MTSLLPVLLTNSVVDGGGVEIFPVPIAIPVNHTAGIDLQVPPSALLRDGGVLHNSTPPGTCFIPQPWCALNPKLCRYTLGETPV
jgi:hypothetical protein